MGTALASRSLSKRLSGASKRGWRENETKPRFAVGPAVPALQEVGFGHGRSTVEGNGHCGLGAEKPCGPHSCLVTPMSPRLRGKHCTALPCTPQLTEGLGPCPPWCTPPQHLRDTPPGPSPPLQCPPHTVERATKSLEICRWSLDMPKH